MIKNLSFVWLLFVVSCSQPNQSSKTNLMPFDEESIIDLGSLSLNTELIEEVNTISSDSIDFASVEKGKMVTQSLIIVNKQLSPLVISESDIDLSSISPFELISNSCIGRITRNRSCQIKLRLSNPNPSNQNISLTKSLKIHNATITLTGEQKLFIENNDPIIGMNVSPLSLDFGVLKNGQAKEMSVIITNKTISAQTINLPVINSNKIIMTNNCSSSLQRNRSCSIKFKYSASEDEERLNEELISIANNPIKYSVNVESPTNEAPEETLVSPNGLDLSLSLTEPELKKGSVTFVNNGLENFPSPVVAISSHSGIIINSTSCSGGLSRRRTCLVQYSINTSLLPSGISSQKIQLQSNTLISKPHNLSLDITKLSPQETECTLADAALNQVNFANSHSTVRGFKIGNDVSNCLLDFQACYNNYIPANGFKECRALTSQCSYADALLNQVVFLNSSYTTVGQRVGSNVENCLLMDCDENFQLAGDAKSCVPKNGNCSIADATLNQVNFANSNSTLSGSKIGTDVSSCVLDSQACLPNFELSPNAKSCVAKVSNCTSSDAILNLVNLDNSNQQVIGSRIGNNVEQCLLAPNSCSPNYLLNQSSSACIAKTCQSLDGNELADLGYDLTGATISGSFGSCIVTCNDTVNQQVANDGKSCENKPIVILPTATNPVISPTSFALDVQTPNQPTYSFTVKNNLTVTVNGPFVAIPSHKAITIVTNGCNINLTNRGNCPISYKINSELLPIGVSTHTIHVQNLTNSTPAPLTLTITVNPPQEVLVASPVSRDVTVTAPNVLTGSFSVTNKGLDQTGPFIATPSHAGITITSNNCPALLLRNRYCTISYSLDPNLLPSGLSNQSISVESTTDVTEIPFGLNITVIK